MESGCVGRSCVLGCKMSFVEGKCAGFDLGGIGDEPKQRVMARQGKVCFSSDFSLILVSV